MTNYKYVKHERIDMKSDSDFNEKWLQSHIAEDLNMVDTIRELCTNWNGGILEYWKNGFCPPIL